MSQIVPQLSYPGGCSAFFTDLYFDFSRWLRLVALVPLVHASIEGIHSEGLCSHLLSILPASGPSNILAVSVERIRLLVFEMLFEEPFFVCPFSDGKSTSRWIYEPSLDSEPSRISFAFRILLCVKLYPNWSASDLLSKVACVTHPQTPSFTAPNIWETCRQRGRLPSRNCISDPWFPRSNSVPPVRVPISLLIETSVSPMKAGQDPSVHLESFSSGSDQTITSEPLHPPRSLDTHPEAGLEAMGSKPSTFDLGTRHLSGPYEVPLRPFVSPVLSIVRSHSAGADLAMDTQQYKGSSDFPALLGRSTIFSSGSCCDLSDSPRAKTPLFLPSQTPNRDFPPQDSLSSQAPGSKNERTGPLLVQSHSRVLPHNDYPHVSPLYTSTLQNVDANNLEAISLHDGRSFHATSFTTPKPTKSTWPIELASNDCPHTPAQRKNNSPRYQRPGSLGKRDRLSSGCATNKTKSSWALHARGDSASGETPEPKRTRRTATPARGMTQDVPFNAHPTNLTMTPSLLSPLDFGDRQGMSRVEGTQIHPSKPSATTQDDRVIPGQGCALITRSLDAPYPDLGQNPHFGGACRPSVIVYKVTRGSNLVKSKDVVRISYGEGSQKRTRMKFSGRRSKRGDATMHLDMKSKADIKATYRLLPAERIEGDMAWNFGVGSEMGDSRANMHRPRVRIGGLTRDRKSVV